MALTNSYQQKSHQHQFLSRSAGSLGDEKTQKKRRLPTKIPSPRSCWWRGWAHGDWITCVSLIGPISILPSAIDTLLFFSLPSLLLVPFWCWLFGGWYFSVTPLTPGSNSRQPASQADTSSMSASTTSTVGWMSVDRIDHWHCCYRTMQIFLPRYFAFFWMSKSIHKF